MAATLFSLLPLALPLLLLAGALPWRRRWQVAGRLNALAVATAILSAALPPLLGAPATELRGGLLNPAGYAHVIAVLVTFLGWITVNYSRNHLRGEAGRDRYLAMLQFTLAAVLVVVLGDHLLVLLGGWVAISLGLHHLLLFYPDRPRATLAAHKKFLLARVAELALLGAVLLLHAEFGTWRITEIGAVLAVAAPGPGAQAAALLLAIVALIKCAQLPVHGWLIQVTEAPTPVSALLHAGIINLGGFLLVLFAPLLAQVPAAQALLLVVAGPTAVVAALVMRAQVSIKVRLAWSTSAQMGLMLVQCALGLFELALLHLLAHSCYKAYAFLASGDAVVQFVGRSQAPRQPRSPRSWLLSGLVALTLVTGAALLLGDGGPLSPWLLAAALLTCFLVERGAAVRSAPALTGAALALLLLAAYLLQKTGFTTLLSLAPPVPALAPDLWIATLVVALFATFWMLQERPGTRFSRRLEVLLLAGFHLDEWFTRTTLRVWPIRFPQRPRRKRAAEPSMETS